MAKNDSATVVRYKENPFIKELVVPVGKQNVRVSRLGKDDNILVNQATGEVHGTHVAAYRKVDKEELSQSQQAEFIYLILCTVSGVAAGLQNTG